MPNKAPRQPARLWQCRVRSALLPFGLWCALPIAVAADTITDARFTEPTTRYAHGVLGDNIEYGALELVVDDTVVTVRLPQDRVFEDLAPRLADIDRDGAVEAIVVETQNTTGAQLAIYNAAGEKIAATPHIGARFRWLAPVGAADLDGDGNIEIAYIDRPHLAKTLRIWRFKDGGLTEIAALPGLTNHKIGEDFISGGLRSCGDHPEMILASADWSRIIRVSYQDGWHLTDLGPLKQRDNLTSALNC